MKGQKPNIPSVGFQTFPKSNEANGYAFRIGHDRTSSAMVTTTISRTGSSVNTKKIRWANLFCLARDTATGRDIRPVVFSIRLGVLIGFAWFI
jgi:hypothetical protein